MGINGSATCVLNFGDNGACVGELVGTVENQGMPQMFKMMNGARIGVGIQGLSVASGRLPERPRVRPRAQAGLQHQGLEGPHGARVSIIEHPDVRRMLLDMKAKVEGIRALIVKLSMHSDRALVIGGNGRRLGGVPPGPGRPAHALVKAYSSDQGFRVCETAIQTYGGAGYLQDYPVEQYCRDSKIFSIYEGTNHIQSMDLVGRKLGRPAAPTPRRSSVTSRSSSRRTPRTRRSAPR
jgi:alkylation response protein AidB-like acyl-CoA dehydrogenase